MTPTRDRQTDGEGSVVTDEDRAGWRVDLRADIDEHGYQVTLVRGGESPRFAYTVGLTEASRPELIVAGACLLSAREVLDVLRHASTNDDALDVGAVLSVPEIGSFTVGAVHESWAKELLLGAFDFYDDPAVQQLLPADGVRKTIDVPDLSRPREPAREPVWRWLTESCPFEPSPDAAAVTDLDALHDKPVVEVMRWEHDQWELFSRPSDDIPRDQMHVVHLETMLASDPALEAILGVEIERGLRREPHGSWELR